MSDKEFYRKIYAAVYADDPEYGAGHGMHLRGVVAEALLANDAPILVDCGGGRHQFAGAVRQIVDQRNRLAIIYSLDIHRHEPIPPGVMFVQDAMWDLSQIPVSVDVITAFDSLEHLKEEHVAQTVKAWHAKLKPGGMLFMTIPVGRAGHKAPEGVDNLHMTVKPTIWWKEQFAPFFTFPDHPQQKPPQIVAVRKEL
jgi:hypothetical protein